MVSKTVPALIAAVIVALLAGSAGYVFFYEKPRLSSLIDNVDVVDLKVSYMDPVGTPVMKRIDLLVVIDVKNYGSVEAYVKSIEFSLFVNGIYAGSGSVSDITIAGDGIETASTLVHVYSKEAIKILLESLTYNKSVLIQVNGTIKTPITIASYEVDFVSKQFSIDTLQELPWPIDKEYLSVVEAVFGKPETIVDRPVDIVVSLFSVSKRDLRVDIVVKKDLVSQPDKEVYRYTTSISLKGYAVIDLSWTPYESSSDTVRGYYIEVYVNGEKYYTMEDSYPPRLRVISKASIARVVDVYWVIGGVKNYTAKVGDQVRVVVVLTSTEEIDVNIKIVVKLDLTLRPDRVVVEKTFTITLKPFTNNTLEIEFIPEEKSTLFTKGYFVEVYIDGEKVYSMPPDYPPRLRVIG